MVLILKNKQNKKIDTKLTQYGHHSLFSIIVSTRLRNGLHTFKINSSNILFRSSSIAVLSGPIFG